MSKKHLTLAALVLSSACDPAARVPEESPPPTHGDVTDGGSPSAPSGSLTTHRSGPDTRASAQRDVFVPGTTCDRPLTLMLPGGGHLVGEVLPDHGTPNTVCRSSSAPQRFYAFALPAHQHAEITATPTGSPWRLVLRAMASCIAHDCLTDEESVSPGAVVTIGIDSPGDETLTKIVTVSASEAGIAGSFDLDVRLSPIGGSTGGPPDQYVVTEIGTFGGDSSFASSINSLGHVAGTATDGDSNLARGFLWDRGVLRHIGLSTGNSINDADHIAGEVGHDCTGPALWRDGGSILLAGVSNTCSGYPTAHGVNRSDHVVGDAPHNSGASSPQGFLWREGMPNLYFADMVPQAINDLDQVVGTGPGGATLWWGGVFTTLAAPADSASSAIAINNRSDVVGVIYQPDTTFRATLWAHGTTTDLGTLGGTRSEARAINDDEMIVGSASIAATGTSGESIDHAFVYSHDRGIRDLNALTVNGSAWVLDSAFGINASGQIAGHGFYRGQPRGFLLTPGATCPAGTTSCDSGCSYLRDREDCGGCGVACNLDTCDAGACACAPGRTNCGGHCVDLADNYANCGACGVTCGTGVCSNSICCPFGTINCGGTCIDTSSNDANCGACGHACTAGTHCVSNACSM